MNQEFIKLHIELLEEKSKILYTVRIQAAIKLIRRKIILLTTTAKKIHILTSKVRT